MNVPCSPFGNMERGYGERAVYYAGPELWNEIPEQIRDISEYQQFKRAITTHIFKQHLKL